jgi:hypothetical protein
MAEHTLRLELSWTGPTLYLRCEHLRVLPWHGEYDENGTLISDALTPRCWTTDWVDHHGVEDLLDETFDIDDVRLPLPVRCYFDGDSLRVGPEER